MATMFAFSFTGAAACRRRRDSCPFDQGGHTPGIDEALEIRLASRLLVVDDLLGAF